MRHVAYPDGSVALVRIGECHESGILEIVIVPSVEEAVSLGIPGLETGAVEHRHLSVVTGDLGTLDIQWQALADTADDIVQKGRVAVEVRSDDIVKVVLRLVLHRVEIVIAVDLLDGGDGCDFTVPDDNCRCERGILF